MKTTTELFKAFTENRKATINRGEWNLRGAKEYFISQKQSVWLSSLIFAKAQGINGGNLCTTSQYIETIDGKNYSLIQGKRTHRIRVI